MQLRVSLVAAAVVAAAALPAQAGFVVGSLEFDPSDDAPHTIGYTYEGVEETLALTATISVKENVPCATGFDAYVDIRGAVDSDPVLRMIEELTNDSAATWTQFIIKVSDNDPFNDNVVFTGTAASNQFASYEFLENNTKLRFFGGEVTPGETLELDFRLLIPATYPSFAFCFEQGPGIVPEPASLGLLGLGALGLLGRRRR